ncbi:MAG: DUF1028 domain-containing protein [Rhizobiaceae bacterium]|nr:DUF1028 domain-containing protein [Rhizobiaceae bacterium]MCV0408237.1 DUF1028 domain-containing protein [Rhizobiaceae bacterium]
MTFSIIARCPRTGQFGAAATTALPAVGKFVTHAFPDAGAVATQAWLNPYLGIDGLALLREGLDASQVVERLKQEDPRIDLRQFAVIDRAGRTACWTGTNCSGWAGSLDGDSYSLQGNRLYGRHVLEAAARVFEMSPEHALVDRLIDALAAGVAEGGDKKGESSAAIYVVEDEEYPMWDVRVDEHDDPVEELRRLKGIFAKKLEPHIRNMPRREEPAGGPGDYDV